MRTTTDTEDGRALEVIRLLDQRVQLRGDPRRQTELQQTHAALRALLKELRLEDKPMK